MSYLIDTAGREQLHKLLLTLEPNAVPLWGKMQPQQMLEHLIVEVEYSNGKKTATCTRPAADTERDKQQWVHSAVEIPKNLVLETLPDAYWYADMQTAITQLLQELADFDKYFKEPGITATHFFNGAMDYTDWLAWHSKHFTHHFKQFDIFNQRD